MTQERILYWIKENISPLINEALEASKGTIYTEDWLAGMAYREVGFLIARYVDQKMKPEAIHSLMRGDYSRRPGELEKQYHGFGYWQIDIGSFPVFVKSGTWKKPLATCIFAIDVLEEKRKMLTNHFDFSQKPYLLLPKSITAAYNCGQGNVLKALAKGYDVDRYTHNGDYSKMVWQYREAYSKL
jgi:hypothetical protein